MNTAASIRRELNGSLAITPNVLAQTIATQRQQLRDQLHIADEARRQEDWETWAGAARNAADVARALGENLEMQEMSSVTVKEAPVVRLVEETLARAQSDDPEAKQARRLILAAAKKLQSKGAARVR